MGSNPARGVLFFVGFKMNSRDFCFWLQGFFELSRVGDDSAINYAQKELIERHLSLVFKHEIDPSIDGGNQDRKDELDGAHAGDPPYTGAITFPPKFRC